MNRGENEFDPLEAGLGAARRGLGACPGAEALAGFAAGSLPTDEAARIQAHVAACGVCDSLVESLHEFDEPVTATPPGWAPTERRLRARVFPKPRWWRWVLHPAVAYGIALAAVIVAVIPDRHPASPTLPAPITIAGESVPTIDLNLTRGAEAPHIPPGVGNKLLLLSFLIDIHPGLHYSASLDGGNTREVVSIDGKGNFAVLFSRNLLGPGRHRLTVIEINPATGKTERSLEFAFQI